MPSKEQRLETGPWDTVLGQIREWDPQWADACAKMTTNPWNSTVLPRKLIELISLAINAACTNLMAIHSCSLGAPILIEEARAAGVTQTRKTSAATPACDAMRAIGQWNTAWDSFFELDPVWTDQFFATAISMYKSGALAPKEVELLSIACDASFTHMYAPGTHRHIKAALKLGATMEEVMEVAVRSADADRILLQQAQGRFAEAFHAGGSGGPDVLELQVAMVNASGATPGLRSVSVVIPQLRILNAAQSLATGSYAFVGSAEAEMKATDTSTGELLAAAVDKRAGGIALSSAVQWKWGDAENAMNYWTEKVTNRLRELQGRAATAQ